MVNACNSHYAAVRWDQDGTISITQSGCAVAAIAQSEQKPLLDEEEQTTDDEGATQFITKV